MANRPAFCIREGKVIREDYDFQWYAGLSASQKQKCGLSLHEAIRAADASARILEVSTKSTEPLGVRMSAFNLKLDGYPLENVFQSGKIFEFGGPFPDLLHEHPRRAKVLIQQRAAGALTGFRYQGADFPTEPKTLFYDYLYLRAVRESLSAGEIQQLSEYVYFTDIEFNPKKSINTQAKSAAVLRLLLEIHGALPDMSAEDFLQFHQAHVTA